MKRLLYIAHRLPYPPDKGERVRAHAQVGALCEHFDVTLAALVHRRGANAGDLADCCEQVVAVRPERVFSGWLRTPAALVTGRSMTEEFFHSGRLHRRIRDLCRDEPFDMVLGYCSSMLPYVLRARAAVRVLDLVDVDGAKWGEYARRSSGLRRWVYAREQKRVAGLERCCLRSCDAVLTVSDAEAKLLPAGQGRVVPVGNGVDLDKFAPGSATPAGPFDLVFTGTMSYRPNIEAVEWFCREVLPKLRARRGQTSFAIVGREPAPSVRKLGGIDGVTVTGAVDDVRGYLAGASVAVVPLQTARGIQNKVLEAMAMGLPVVASEPALEGIEAETGTEAIAAGEPGQWVDTLAGLLDEPQHRKEIGYAARRRMELSYTWPSRLEPLIGLCRELAGASAPTEAPPASLREGAVHA